MRRVPFFLCLSAIVAVTAACGADGGTSPSGAVTPPAAVSKSAPVELGTLKESGFGQRDEYVWVTAVVHNNSEYVGQTVTVNFATSKASG